MKKKTIKKQQTHVDEFNLPDLLDQLHGGVAIDEEGLGVVSQFQGLQPLRYRRGVVPVIAHGTHLQREKGQRKKGRGRETGRGREKGRREKGREREKGRRKKGRGREIH